MVKHHNLLFNVWNSITGYLIRVWYEWFYLFYCYAKDATVIGHTWQHVNKNGGQIRDLIIDSCQNVIADSWLFSLIRD